MPRLIGNHNLLTLTGSCSSIVARSCATFSPRLARRYAKWYRNQTIRYPNWLGPVTWERTIRLSTGAVYSARFREVIGMNLLLEGVHEPEITSRMLELLNPGDVFIDVGANIGYYTLLASHAVGDGGLVLSFEPSPENVGLLGHNLALNQAQNVVMFSEALSDHQGMAKLSLPWYFNSGVCSLGRGPSADGTFDGGFTLTALRTLDEVLDAVNFKRSVTLVKIDAEGHEMHVLRGMKNLLSTTGNLQIACELSPESYSANELLEYMQGFGFEAEYLRNGAWEADSSSVSSGCLCNAWFVKR